MKHIRIICKYCVILFLSTSILSCKKDKEETGQDLIQKHGLAEVFKAQITPTFMGASPMASGEHTIYLEDIGNGQLRMHFEKFRVDPMPFEMTVDMKLNLKQGTDNRIMVAGDAGTFKAVPPNGGSIDPDEIPGGIQLPPGAEDGLSSNQASIIGTFAEIEKDGVKTWRYDLKLTPGIPLPIEIIIYTKNKIKL